MITLLRKNDGGARGAEIVLEEPEHVFVTVVGQSSSEVARPYELVRRIIPKRECKPHRPEEDYHTQHVQQVLKEGENWTFFNLRSFG